MIIQHNLASINARNKLKSNVCGLKKSSEKLSSGYRINRAGDDAAGLAVSEKMRSQIRGLNVAVRNSQDGINLIKTFEGALGETVAIIQRMRSLAEESANGTYDNDIDRSAIELEYIQLCDETDHIAETDYNGIVMLSGNPESAAKAMELERSINEAVESLPEIVSEPSAQTAAPEIKAETYAAESAMSASPTAYTAPKAGGVACGDFTVYGNSSDFSFDNATGALTILGGDVTVEGTGAATTNTIVVAMNKSANVTLRNINIDVSATYEACAFKIEDDSKGNVNIILEGQNTFISGDGQAGIQKNCSSSNNYKDFGTLTISGDGFLYAESKVKHGDDDYSGAGIGGGYDHNSYNITIENGNITTIGIQGSGIGGGAQGHGGNIVINGGNIIASSIYDSGIGGGMNGNADDIIINGGNIVATGGKDGGAGIGGGIYGTANNITINGGTINASSKSNGAGIGGGFTGCGHNIIINGGIITAIGGGTTGNMSANEISSGAGIGCGGMCYDGYDDSSITINGGTVTAIGGTNGTIGASAIGGGDSGTSTVNIGGKDTVVMAKGGKDADDIGNGSKSTTNSTVNIDNILTKEPYTGNGIVDGTIVHYTGKDPNPPDPDDPDSPNIPGDPDKLIVSIPDAFGNSAARLTYTDELILQTGARTKDSVKFTFAYSADGIGELNADLNCTANGLGLSALSLKTQDSANYAIDRLDHALNKISMIRATFGAAQNRLEHKIANLSTSSENLTEAESSVRDTDMASEMMNFTKSNILQQAAQTMLAQANQMPQSTLQLLE